ncbi:MAG: isochorismate synthase, partial [Acidimicrobiales bacterium]
MRAVTRALPPGPIVDAFAVCGDTGVYFSNERLTLAGAGCAAVLPLPGGLAGGSGVAAVDGWLSSLERDDLVMLPGTGPVAFGALSFESEAVGALVVPAVVYGRAADGTEWVTVVDEVPVLEPSREWLLSEVSTPRRIEPAAKLQIVDTQPADYRASVVEATRAIARGELRKVVLARRLLVQTDQPIVASAVLGRMASNEPSSTAFLIGRSDEAFVGASPELLVSRRGRGVLSHPLAGTAALDEQRGAGLLRSEKDHEEHELVVSDIARVLDPLCTELVVPGEPALVALHTMAHLGTRIEGQLMEERGRIPSALELAAALHPTAAVGGVPRDEALTLIRTLEPGPRGPWAGPIGWVGANGDGDWMIALRSATLAATTATI